MLALLNGGACACSFTLVCSLTSMSHMMYLHIEGSNMEDWSRSTQEKEVLPSCQ